MKPTTDSTRFDVGIEYFDRRKGDLIPADAPRSMEIDLELPEFSGKFANRPDWDKIFSRARELVVANCDLEKVRDVYIHNPYTGCVVARNVMSDKPYFI